MVSGMVPIAHLVCPALPPVRKDETVERSLSVLLPVQNAESTLAVTVDRMLDIASDLTDRFELIIVDDGSTDATSEVADELARCYPQVKTTRHQFPRGPQQSLESGLRLCHGQVVIHRDTSCGEAIEDLARTWAAMKLGDIPAPADARGYRVIDRASGKQLHGPSRTTPRPAYVTRLREFALGE